jgi:hypothetical protein
MVVALPLIVNVFVELLPAFAFNVTDAVPMLILDFTSTVTGPVIAAAFQAVAKVDQLTKFVELAA